MPGTPSRCGHCSGCSPRLPRPRQRRPPIWLTCCQSAAGPHLEAVPRRMGAAARLAEREPRLAALDEARLAAIEAHHRLVDEHQHLLDTRLAGIAAELAAGLAEGSPCRVCGSPAHPEPALACGRTVSADEVEEARLRREAADVQRAE